MKIRVDPHEPFEFDPDLSLAELAHRVAAASGVTLGSDSHLLVIDADRFFDSPQLRDDALCVYLRDSDPIELEVKLCRMERCQHGSPAVPGRGFLCGWC